MKAEIITIGDEILLGQTIDTNSAWLGEELAKRGIKVNRIITISDEKSEIVNSLNESLSRVDLILMTGGLGPTQDDITKSTLAEYFHSDFYRDKEVEAGITAYFNSKGREPLPANLEQANLPTKAHIVRNVRGTASGMWFEKEAQVVMSMPGVPNEMKGMMRDEVFDKIAITFATPNVYNRTILTIGVGESRIAQKLENWENELRASGLSLAYLPSAGLVKLRVSGVGEEKSDIKKQVDSRVEQAVQILGDIVYGYDNDSLASVVGTLLEKRGETLSFAESCTGGYMSHLITSVPGSSKYYEGSAVTYSYDAKENLVGVNSEDLLKFGAVSKQVVEQMASGVREKFGTTYGISASGIAGPGGATDDKPVGTVWVGLATENKVASYLFNFSKNRMRNIRMTSNSALNLLRKELIE